LSPPSAALRESAAAAGRQAPPVHVAIIMDGNRRWARSRGMPPAYGHRRGADAVRRTVEACAREGVRYLTLFAFSSENWRRPAGEVGDLMDLLRVYLQREIDELAKNDIRLTVIGDRSGLAPDIRAMIGEAELRTRGNGRLDVVIALNYGSRREIVEPAPGGSGRRTWTRRSSPAGSRPPASPTPTCSSAPAASSGSATSSSGSSPTPSSSSCP
jgi:undecaprenyl pyrophosphate synthase